MPTQRHVIIAAYTGAADTALKIVAMVVLAVGALITAELTWACRPPRVEAAA